MILRLLSVQSVIELSVDNALKDIMIQNSAIQIYYKNLIIFQ